MVEYEDGASGPAARPKITLLMQAALQKILNSQTFHPHSTRQERCRPESDGTLSHPKTGGAAVIAPPSIPSERLAALRAGFIALAKDKEFIADAQNTRLEVAPISGEAVDKVISLDHLGVPETTERLGKAIGSEN